MKTAKALILFLTLALSAAKLAAQSLPKRPDPPRLVNDFTGTLTQAQKEALEVKLVAFDDSTSTQIAVVIIQSLDGYDVADYNTKLGREWGVGDKEFNNGVVLLISTDDRKMNIATGYGVEGALPDITCKHIIEEEIVPNFKQDDYYRGIEKGTDAIIKAVKGEYNTPRKKKKRFDPGIILFLVILTLAMLKKGGGSGGSFASRRGVRSFGGPVIWGSGLGGGRSSGGGGFGGFGGGSFGGGGASGSW